MKKFITIFCFLSLGCLIKIHAQNFWKLTNENDLAARSDLFLNNYKPLKFVSFQLNEAAFRDQLKSAPSEKTISAGKSTFIISVPVSSGDIERFRIVEASVMEPALAAKHPDLKSYAGQGVDDPSSTIRFSMTPVGFRAMIRSGKRNAIYINPVEKSSHTYIVFDGDHLSESKNNLACLTPSALDETGKDENGTLAGTGFKDGKLRVYKFAVATGGEFSKLCLNGSETTDAQKKASVLDVLVTDLTIMDGIMEADLGIRFDYVANEDTIIFLNGKTDPFESKESGINGKWNTECQTTCDSLIGSANYDIGHVLMGYLTGGNAYKIGSVCKAATKGTGATGFTEDLTSDPFVVDFWIHELGHQLGENHTFDFSNEGTGAQMEPGSGITIMGYAGVTGKYDDSAHSIPYFHSYSIQQTLAYVTTGAGANCAVLDATGDHAPTANAGSNYTIPKSTPFMLTGSGSDADRSDVLTYDWEQFDVWQKKGSSAIPKSTSTTGPQFRVYDATVSNIRIVPALQYILSGNNNYKWEVLPSVSRTLNFRLTVRDNHSGGGQNNSDDMKIIVDSSSGPFKVTVANTKGLVLNGKQNYIVTWDVANTTEAPVNCSKVDIILSTDGGQTFTDTLARHAPNNGSANIVVPNVNSKKCRIMVASVGNIFFDINDADFTIAKATAPVAVSQNINAFLVYPNPATTNIAVAIKTDLNNVQFALTGANGGTVYNLRLSKASAGQIINIPSGRFAKGVYILKVQSNEGVKTESIVVQ